MAVLIKGKRGYKGESDNDSWHFALGLLEPDALNGAQWLSMALNAWVVQCGHGSKKTYLPGDRLVGTLRYSPTTGRAISVSTCRASTPQAQLHARPGSRSVRWTIRPTLGPTLGQTLGSRVANASTLKNKCVFLCTYKSMHVSFSLNAMSHDRRPALVCVPQFH